MATGRRKRHWVRRLDWACEPSVPDFPPCPVEQSRAGVAGEQRSEGGEKRESREKQSSGAGPDSSAAAACSGVVCARRRLDASQLLMWPLDPRWQSKPPKTSQNRL